MTRETKIGLLVGLAFIIVVGILLSEHLTSATERPAAQLADAGHNLRAGVSAPGTPGMDDAAPLRAAEPQQQVPTARDLMPPAPAARVVINNPAPANGGTQNIVIHDDAQPPVTPATPNNTAVNNPVNNDAPIITKLPTTPNTTDPFANDPIAKIAAQHGEAVVPIDAKTNGGTTPAQNTTTTTAAREYKAIAGDTLSRMAALLPGGSSKANRDAIVKLNPSLQKDANRIISGHTYLLPTDKAAAPVAVANSAKPALKIPAAPVENTNKTDSTKTDGTKPDNAVATTTGQRVYVVKAGDTLSKIAQAELGSKSQVAMLKKLNDDVLKGSDTIKIDMKLKLPAKTVASAS